MKKVYRKSWVTMVIPVIISLVSIAIIFATPTSQGFFVPFSILLLICIIYMIQLRYFRIELTDEGVWRFQGIFPWNKKKEFSSWASTSYAEIENNFSSWLLKSYKVKIDISDTYSNVHNGKQLVNQINRIIAEKQGKSENWLKSHQY